MACWKVSDLRFEISRVQILLRVRLQAHWLDASARVLTVIINLPLNVSKHSLFKKHLDVVSPLTEILTHKNDLTLHDVKIYY